VASTEAGISDIKVTGDTITAYLIDGRVISVPLAWSWRLSEATPTQREHWNLGDGQGVHWPDIDEDISAEGMLHGIPANRPSTRRKRHEPLGRRLPTTQARRPVPSKTASRSRLRS
jgi:hypothetical protein